MTIHDSIPRARKIISFLLEEECTYENIVRLLNYQFEDTFRCRDITNPKGDIKECVFELVSDSGVAIPLVREPFNIFNASRSNESRAG